MINYDITYNNFTCTIKIVSDIDKIDFDSDDFRIEVLDLLDYCQSNKTKEERDEELKWYTSPTSSFSNFEINKENTKLYTICDKPSSNITKSTYYSNIDDFCNSDTLSLIKNGFQFYASEDLKTLFIKCVAKGKTDLRVINTNTKYVLYDNNMGKYCLLLLNQQINYVDDYNDATKISSLDEMNYIMTRLHNTKYVNYDNMLIYALYEKNNEFYIWKHYTVTSTSAGSSYIINTDTPIIDDPTYKPKNTNYVGINTALINVSLDKTHIISFQINLLPKLITSDIYQVANSSYTETCLTCNGDGEIDCPNCSGTGIYYIKCNTCDGIGFVPNTICESGCDCSDRIGQTTCPDCSGTGKISATCTNCDSTTHKIICPTCNGNKKFNSDPQLPNGTTRIDYNWNNNTEDENNLYVNNSSATYSASYYMQYNGKITETTGINTELTPLYSVTTSAYVSDFLKNGTFIPYTGTEEITRGFDFNNVTSISSYLYNSNNSSYIELTYNSSYSALTDEYYFITATDSNGNKIGIHDKMYITEFTQNISADVNTVTKNQILMRFSL